MNSFADLGLSESALKAVELLGYEQPTPVQEQAIPAVLAGKDLIAAAKTGTGKTAAFSLPCLDRIKIDKSIKAPRLVVVTPTRELANQISEVCATIASVSRHRVVTVVGGVSLDPQIRKLKKGADVLIATPGRLIDLMGQNAVTLASVEILVLDEADRMLDMGFLPAMRKIVDATPETRQTLLFSATVDRSIRKQMDALLHDPELIQIAHKGETADTVEQYIARVPQTLKFDLLKATLKAYGHKRVIVFARTRHRADSTCRRLKKSGYHAEALHSDRSQNQRMRALANFASGETDVLVATDVLARGIDVEGVSYVVNFDLPTMPEDYVHRIGRTGRAGNEGFALSFVSPETEDALKDIQKFIKKEIPVREVEGFSIEEAEEQAAARATRASARKDPELAEAARELKKKERRKEKAREKAAEEAAEAQENNSGKKGKSSAKAGKGKVQKSAKPPKSGSGQNRANSTQAASRAAKRTAAGQPEAERKEKGPKNPPKPKTKAKGKGETKNRGSQNGHGKPRTKSESRKPSAKPGAGRSPKQDMRPGRSQRAARAKGPRR